MLSRRRFLSSSPAFLLAARSAFASPPHAPQATRIYIGTAGSGPGQGILTADWNASTGEIGAITLAAEITQPTFLATHRLGAEYILYTVSEVNGKQAKVSAFTTTAGQKILKLLNQADTMGGGPTHVSVTPDGRSVFVANYGGGSVTSFHTLADGSLSAPVSHFQFSGSGPYKGRQDAPHTHSAMPSPDGRYVLVNDLGLDRIMVFHLNPATSEMTPANPPFWSGKPGSGPRHIAWSPNGRFVFSTNELDSTVSVLAWDESTSTLRSIAAVSTLRTDFPPNTAFVGEVAASADGRNVYAGNRVADDTIAVFAVNRKTGALTQIQLAESGGKNSRHIALDPTQRWMVVSHQNSNDLTVLGRDRRTGKLSPTGHTYPVQKPMCVVFV